MSKECILSILKRPSAAKPSFEILRFDIRLFCGSLLNLAAKAACLIIKKPCHFGVVSHEWIAPGVEKNLRPTGGVPRIFVSLDSADQ